MPHWMLGPDGWTMPVCEIDLRPGGAWHFVWRGSDGTEMEMRGVYREIAPPERLVTTESWGGDWPETLNTLVLTEEDGKTTIGVHGPLPVEGGSRRGARDRDEGRRVRRATIVSTSTCERSRNAQARLSRRSVRARALA